MLHDLLPAALRTPRGDELEYRVNTTVGDVVPLYDFR